MTTYKLIPPPEPEGPIWDKDGDKWERVGNMWAFSSTISRNWEKLLAGWGPVTDHPPYELHKRYMSDQLDHLPEGSLLFTLGPYDGVQYVARVMGKWYAWWPAGHDWVFGEAENLDDIAPSFSIHRIGWPEVPAGYDGTLSDLLLIGENK